MKFFTEMFYDTKVGILEFHFERMGDPSTTGYEVAVARGTNNTHHFIMLQIQSKWKIVDPSNLPAWITDLETALSDSINAHSTRSAVIG